VPTGYGNRPTAGGTKSGTLADENAALERLAEALIGLSPEERDRLAAMLASKAREA